MSQISRKWIEDKAINASKIDSTSTDQTYVMHGLQITADATVGGGFKVGGISNLSDTTISGDASVIGNLTVDGPAQINSTLTVTSKTFFLSDSTVTGNLQITGEIDAGYLSVPSINVSGDGTFGGGLSVANRTTTSSLIVLGDSTVSGGLSIANRTTTTSLTAPQIVGDSTISGGLSIANRTTTTSLTAPQIVGDSTISGGLSIANRTTTTSLTAPQIVGDSTISGGLSIANRTTTTSLTAPQIVGDSTVSGGLSIANRTTTTSLTAPQIVGDSTISGGLSIANRTTTTSLTAPQIVGDSTVSGGLSIANRTTTTSLTAPQIVGDTTATGGIRANLLSSSKLSVGTTNTDTLVNLLVADSNWGSTPPVTSQIYFKNDTNVFESWNGIMFGANDGLGLIPTTAGIGAQYLQRNGFDHTLPTDIVFLTGDNLVNPMAERMRIKSYGNVGIGADPITAKFQINTGASTQVMIGQHPVSPTYNVLSVNGSLSPGVAAGLLGGSSGVPHLYVDSGNQGELHLQTGNGSSYIDRLVISGTAPIITITGDTTVASGGLSIANRTTTTSLTAPQIIGDSTISGGLSIANRTTTTSLTAPQIIGDSTISGGLSIANRTTTTSLTAPQIIGDSTISGGLSIANRTTTTSLTAPQIIGDSTVGGALQVSSTFLASSGVIVGGKILLGLTGLPFSAYYPIQGRNSITGYHFGIDPSYPSAGHTRGRFYTDATDGMEFVSENFPIYFVNGASNVKITDGLLQVLTTPYLSLGSLAGLGSGGYGLLSSNGALQLASIGGNIDMTAGSGCHISLASDTTGSGRIYASKISAYTGLQCQNIDLPDLAPVSDMYIFSTNYAGSTLHVNGHLTVVNDIYTQAIQTWPIGSSNPQGFSSNEYYAMHYKKVGKLVHLWFDIVGTPSIDTFFTFTLPVTISTSGPSGYFFTLPFIIDDGVSSSTPGCLIISDTTNVQVYRTCDTGGAVWTVGANPKAAGGYICYEANT
jgi:hypothetical protein